MACDMYAVITYVVAMYSCADEQDDTCRCIDMMMRHKPCPRACLLCPCPCPMLLATIGSPAMHAGCLEQLSVLCPVGSSILDIGTGSGYMTAALAMLVGDKGRVVAIDVKPRLSQYIAACGMSCRGTSVQHVQTISDAVSYVWLMFVLRACVITAADVM